MSRSEKIRLALMLAITIYSLGVLLFTAGIVALGAGLVAFSSGLYIGRAIAAYKWRTK